MKKLPKCKFFLLLTFSLLACNHHTNLLIGQFIEIYPNIECTFELKQEGKISHVTPIFRGKNSLPEPIKIVAELQQDRKYEPWAERYSLIDTKIEVFVDDTWLSPHEDAIDCSWIVYPNEENRWNSISFYSITRPTQIRITNLTENKSYAFIVTKE